MRAALVSAVTLAPEAIVAAISPCRHASTFEEHRRSLKISNDGTGSRTTHMLLARGV
jgi:hypothetical protein